MDRMKDMNKGRNAPQNVPLNKKVIQAQMSAHQQITLIVGCEKVGGFNPRQKRPKQALVQAR